MSEPSRTGTAVSSSVLVLERSRSSWKVFASGEIRLHPTNATANATVARARFRDAPAAPIAAMLRLAVPRGPRGKNPAALRVFYRSSPRGDVGNSGRAPPAARNACGRGARPLVPREGTVRRQQERDVVGGEELGSLGERRGPPPRRSGRGPPRRGAGAKRQRPGRHGRGSRPRRSRSRAASRVRRAWPSDSSLRFATFRLRDEVASAIESPVTANHIGTAWITPSGSLVQNTPTRGAPSNSATSGSASTSAERRSRLGFGCEPSCTAAS